MKKTFSAVTGIMLALLMLFVSCEQGGTSKAQIDSRDLVAVSFTKVEAKAVNVDSIGEVSTPALNTLYFQYKAVKNSADTSGVTIGAKDSWTNLGSKGLGTVIQLSRGKWDISLRGFATDALRTAAGTSETASTQAIFEGNITKDVGSNLASRTENVNVSLDFTNPSGTGSYSLAVTIPASYASQQAKVKVTVTPASGNAQVQTFQFAEGTATHTYSFSTVNNGIASVKVEYLDASDVAIGDAVTANTLIMTDMTTTGTATVSEDNTFGINFSGTSVNGSAEESVLNIELSDYAFVVCTGNILDGAITKAKVPLVGYCDNQAKLYIMDSLNCTQEEVINNGREIIITKDVDSGNYVLGLSEQTKTFVLQENVTVLAPYIEISSGSVDLNGRTGTQIGPNMEDGMEIVATGENIIHSINPERDYKKVSIVITSLNNSLKSEVLNANLCIIPEA